MTAYSCYRKILDIGNSSISLDELGLMAAGANVQQNSKFSVTVGSIL
jgi:hypothetical protein